jgi:hypothetical protein
MRRAVVLTVAAIAMGMTTAKRVAGQTKRPPDTGAVVGPIAGSVPLPDIDHAFRVHLVDPTEAGILRSALVGAASRLRRSECQTVLSEFHDKRGRSLADVLTSLTVDAPRFLSWLYFRDAPPKNCDGDTLAVTTPGSRVVSVCGRSFERAWRENPPYAEASLIHEMLHSLGLGENPPSSSEITVRVRRHCAAADPRPASRR